MVKLIIQIPCYNEAATLGETLRALPRQVPGVDRVEWLVVDDGSTDGTAEAARAGGADRLLRLPAHQGLARAFAAGLAAARRAGADVIVNTDADNQYDARDIPALVAPVLAGEADLVVGARPIGAMARFSPLEKRLQRVGSWVVRRASGTAVADAPSGFRAFSRAAAARLVVFDEYTYTLETLIQAGQSGLRVLSVPVRVNADRRPSRLVRSLPEYLGRSALTVARVYFRHQPFRVFAGAGALLAVGAAGAAATGRPALAAVSGGAALGSFGLGLVADLLAVNRRLLEDVRTRLLEREEGTNDE